MKFQGKTIWILLALAAGAVGFLILHPPKKKIAEFLAGRYGLDANKLMSYDYGYIHGRFKATKKNEPAFTYKGKRYQTSSGTAIV